MIRHPAVAGTFYPADPNELIELLEYCYLHKLGPKEMPSERGVFEKPIGLICPHAGYKSGIFKEEFRLRKVIRKLLKEGDISDMHPHRSTGINILEDVLKKMITTTFLLHKHSMYQWMYNVIYMLQEILMPGNLR
jgi:hypothetical protein